MLGLKCTFKFKLQWITMNVCTSAGTQARSSVCTPTRGFRHTACTSHIFAASGRKFRKQSAKAKETLMNYVEICNHYKLDWTVNKGFEVGIDLSNII
jgi:hypothetical protein